jgi:hypothetical protein
MQLLMRWTGCAMLLAAVTVMATGCPSGKGTGSNTNPTDKGETHPEAGPHGGPLAEWGEENYHAEFTVDRAAKKATVYILDGSAKKTAAIPAETITVMLTLKPPVTITLKAEPQEGDAKGSASRFSGTNDSLGAKEPFEGEIAGKVGDKPYQGTFKEKGHK